MNIPNPLLVADTARAWHLPESQVERLFDDYALAAHDSRSLEFSKALRRASRRYYIDYSSKGITRHLKATEATAPRQAPKPKPQTNWKADKVVQSLLSSANDTKPAEQLPGQLSLL